jgi:NAD(P)-dependent dehydrogenase (short-subunit alcohol dehydrogenase family)
MQLQGKTIVITGASAGIGRELAHLLARRGAKLG